ncbi:TPA: hypothetical protein ROX88_001029 [Bacillus pseudomycoides]|nr:hypothetical protein [Bacillus pseudomycoides]
MNCNDKIIKLLECVDHAEDNEIEWKSMYIELFYSTEIQDGQIGYSIDLDGQKLTSDKEGDWRAEWVVIGLDSYVGDPVFVDMNDIHCPVYTVQHGEGFWEPIRIADSVEEMIKEFKKITK